MNIQLKMNTLTKNELKACDAICKDLSIVQRFTLSDLSDQIDVTKTTILRFCQKVGYSGYSEFRYDCIKYVNSLSNSEKENKEDEHDSKIINIEKTYIDTIRLIHYTLHDEDVKSLASMIKKARTVRLVGEVNSAISAIQLRYALLMFGIDAHVLQSQTEVRIVDMCVNEEDLMLVFSAGAKTNIVKEVMSLKEDTNCQVALVTMNAQSPLEKEVDRFLLLPSVSTLKNKSLLDSVPIFSIFNEILIRYLND